MSNVTRLTTAYSQLPMEAPPPPTTVAAPVQERETAISFRQIFGTLRRHKLLIGGLALVGTTIAWLVANQITPTYASEGQVLIEPKIQGVVTPGQPLSQNAMTDFLLMETEAAKIKGEDLARITVKDLNLIESPLFNPELAPPRPSRWRSLIAPVLQLIGRGSPQAAVVAVPNAKEIVAGYTPEKRERLNREIADAFKADLQTQTSQTSRILTVRYRSTDPEMTAKAVNGAIKTYLESQAKARGGEAISTLKFLAEQMETTRPQVIEAERKLAEFKAANRIEGDVPALQRLLREAESAQLQAEQKALELEERIRQGGGGSSGGGDGRSPLLAELAQARAEFAAVSARLGPAHPDYIKAQQKVAQLAGAVGGEQYTQKANAAAEAKAARESANRLKSRVDTLIGQLDAVTTGSTQLRVLQSELDLVRGSYEQISKRFAEVSLIEKNPTIPDARQIQEAGVPGGPVAPRKDLITLMALLASLVLGVAVAIVLEMMDSGFRSIHQLEQLTGVPALGMVPFQTGRLRRNVKPWHNVVDKPNSAFSEALRTIRTGIQLSSADQPQRTVVVTSSVPGEGKTTTSLSLAAASAASGARTLIIDCDMRQPSMHKNLEVDNDAGLAEFLSGQRNLEELVHVEPKTGLYYIMAGKRPPSPTDLLGSLRMRRLLQQLGEAFDLVVLDTPPVMAVSDALLLVRQTDATIFVVRWERTRRDVATAGVKMVYEAGARISGMVLTQVDLRRHAQYDYTDSGIYYYRGYKKYYGD